jgi:hypothetical protein
MIGFIIFGASFFTGLGVWLVGIRPYLSRHGVAVITGASWGVSAWADWQQCRELAQTRSDARARALSNYFILVQIGFVIGVILTICGI